MRYAGLLLLAVFTVSTVIAGDETPQAVKDLLEKVKSGDGRAAVGIVAYGKAAVPRPAALKQNISAQEPDRLPIVDAIGEMGAASKEAVPVLVDMARKAKTPYDGVTIHVIVALGKIGPAAKEGLPLLTEVVK